MFNIFIGHYNDYIYDYSHCNDYSHYSTAIVAVIYSMMSLRYSKPLPIPFSKITSPF